MGKTASFFSPYREIRSQQFEESDTFMVGISVHEQFNRKILRITVKDQNIRNKVPWLTSSSDVKFTQSERKSKPTLFIEHSKDKRADGVSVNSGNYSSIRAKDCVFLPVGTHKKLEVVAYLYDLMGEKVLAVTVPESYRLKSPTDIENLYNLTPQPAIDWWPHNK